MRALLVLAFLGVPAMWRRRLDGVIVTGAEPKTEGPQCLLSGRDGEGNMSRRKDCESNAANDARTCTDWDTQGRHGEWIEVQD
jgi:hypothetical protein